MAEIRADSAQAMLQHDLGRPNSIPSHTSCAKRENCIVRAPARRTRRSIGFAGHGDAGLRGAWAAFFFFEKTPHLYSNNIISCTNTLGWRLKPHMTTYISRHRTSCQSMCINVRRSPLLHEPNLLEIINSRLYFPHNMAIRDLTFSSNTSNQV
jgi:hypothetical protein